MTACVFFLFVNGFFSKVHKALCVFKKILLFSFSKLILSCEAIQYPATFFMSDKSESVRMVNDLLELTRSILQECDKDPDLIDLAIKYLLNQKQLLEKLRDIL